MPGTLELTPSLKKIGRAERKLAHLETMLNEWVGKGIEYTDRREVHLQRGHVIARVEDLPPEDVAWEIVESVGHIRGALDKMLVALVESNGRGVSGVGFPFGGLNEHGQPEPFPTERHDSLKKKLTPEQWALVLAQKPYPGGNDVLWAVNQIANADKHRKDLIRAAAALSVQSITISHGIFIGNGSGPGIDLGGDADFVCPDKERESLLASYAFAPGSFHPKVDQTVSVSVVFGPIKPVAGEEVLTTLGHQIRVVKGIVETSGEAFRSA